MLPFLSPKEKNLTIIIWEKSVNGTIIGYWLFFQYNQWRIYYSSKKKSSPLPIKIAYTSSQHEHIDRSPVYIDLEASDYARKREYFASMHRNSSSAKSSVDPTDNDNPSNILNNQ